MKTINEDIKRMLNLMEAQHGVIYPLINEQNGQYWDNLLKGGKQVAQDKIELPSVPLMEPTTNAQVTRQESNAPSSPKRPVFIGIQASATYDISKKPGEGRFLCVVNFFLTDSKNIIVNSNSDATPIILTIKQTLESVNKISNVVINTLPEDKNFIFTFGRTGTNKLLTAFMRQNLSGYIGAEMLKSLNDKLVEWGVPEVPNNISQESF
jgi:hypothetical protein